MVEKGQTALVLKGGLALSSAGGENGSPAVLYLSDLARGASNVEKGAPAVLVKSGLGQAAGGSYDKPPGDTSEGEYINRVELKDVVNVSGDNEGYADFTNVEADVGTLEDVPVTVEISTGGNVNYVRAWLDSDKDTVFLDEKTVEVGSCQDSGGDASESTCEVSTSFEVPEGLLEDVGYRFRITSSRTKFQDPPAEGTDYFGETEDYTLNVVDGEGFPPDTLGVKLTTAESPVAYGQTSTVTAVVKNTKDFSESGTVYLDIQERDGSYTNVDLSGVNGLDPGEYVTKKLQWDTSVGFDSPNDGDETWGCRVRTEADGTAGTEDSDDGNIRVLEGRTKDIYFIEASDEDAGTTVRLEDALGIRQFTISTGNAGTKDVTATEVTITNAGSTGLDYDVDGTDGGGGDEGDPGDVPPGESVTVDMS